MRDRDQLGARTDRALGREIERVLSSAMCSLNRVNTWSSCAGEYRLYRRSSVLGWREE
jgi:hypothetical protein